jgi:hypothetical protein
MTLLQDRLSSAVTTTPLSDGPLLEQDLRSLSHPLQSWQCAL